ncbi:MAG: 4-(cytidine 5'-diphospho)-2-C-methyl-D-erythritol kinase [Calditrichaeota bacterium]|nr:4-(cytidine 5'-diphospho)-2-C-methyl-D-erythritol kinase [Calditrichota bacterium]
MHSRSYPDITYFSDGFLIQSPAKVNLFLRVLGKRSDGYHELETLFQELEWCDELEFRDADEFSLEIEGADLRTDSGNLVVRAAQMLSGVSGRRMRGSILLRKRLPLQGGVGGGSSNGAIALLGLNRLWGLKWEVERLVPLAKDLGADCPFFLYGGLAHALGRGDDIKPLTDHADGTFVLVTPDFGVRTAEVFGKIGVGLTEVEKNAIFNPLWSRETGEAYPLFSPSNDLENIVFQIHPRLRHFRDTLLERGAEYALLSGSGSTVFGVFRSDETARHAAHELARIDGVKVTVCRAVARSRS